MSHGNLLDNQRIIAEVMGHTPELVASWDGDFFASWLPLYDDMGLIGPVLQRPSHRKRSPRGRVQRVTDTVRFLIRHFVMYS